MSEYQVMPDLSPEEYAALKADITENGVLVPVVRDQHGRTIDGHHRSRIADELGVKYRVDVVTVADDEQARSLARKYNLARRHLSREQRRELIASEIEDAPDRSDREIARLMGCDHKTVGSVRRKLRGEVPQSPELSREEAEALQYLEGFRTKITRDLVHVHRVIRAGVTPALIAAQVRQARATFRRDWESRFGDDFAAVDEVMFCQVLDHLAGVHAAWRELWPTFRFDADARDAIWLEAWAELRPAQHQAELDMWREAGVEVAA